MSNYIGNQPSQGEFKRLDSIASSFNGSTTQFNLTYNTASQVAGDPSQLIVSLNGIIQEPMESYTLGIGGNSIIFSSAPASGDTCHIVLLGGVGQTTTPTDGSVTASKLDAALKDYYEDEFTASGGTDYTLSREAVGVNQLMVTIDGIVQPTSAYSATGTTLTISPALPTGTNIRVVHMGVKAGVYVPQAGSIGLNELDLTAIDNRYYQSGDSISVADINFGADGLITQDGVQCTFKADTDGRQAHIMTHDGNEDINLDPSGYIQFEVAGQERMRIDASGNVGIGENIPLGHLHIKSEDTGVSSISAQGDLLVLEGTETGLSILSNPAGAGYINFGDSSDNDIGMIIYDHSANKLAFWVNAQERMRISAEGHVLVGTQTERPDAGTGNAGIQLDYRGVLRAGRAGDCMVLNRQSTDGAIVYFRKDGADVGEIHSYDGDLLIGTGDVGLKFDDGNDLIVPFNITNPSVRNAAIDLGWSGGRFKDLYLSGGINFDVISGNATSNTLDDYEEGIWTPWISFGSPTAGTTGQGYNWQYGKYVKVGGLVTIWFSLGNNNIGTDTGTAYLKGVPFTPSSSSFNFNYFDITGYNLGSSSAWNNQAYVEINSGYGGYGALGYGTRNGSSAMTNSDFANGFRLTGNFTFAV